MIKDKKVFTNFFALHRTNSENYRQSKNIQELFLGKNERWPTITSTLKVKGTAD
jgi:hypothetical protein